MTSADPNLLDRDIRQRDLVPPAELARCHAVVIGVGSIGRQVALQLAATGVPMMTLYDPDTVGAENLAPQGFWESDVGDPKVDAAANVCHEQFPQMELNGRHERFRRSAVQSWPSDRVTAVFCCVDSIATRRLVWDAVHGTAGFFADGRMAAEVVRVLASGQPAADTLLSDELVFCRRGVRRQLHIQVHDLRGERGSRADGGPVRPLVAAPASRPRPDPESARRRVDCAGNGRLTW